MKGSKESLSSTTESSSSTCLPTFREKMDLKSKAKIATWKKTYDKVFDGVGSNSSAKQLPQDERLNPIPVTIKDIQKYAHYQEEFTAPTITAAPILVGTDDVPRFKPLVEPPRFDSILAYLPPQLKETASNLEKELVDDEIKRLVEGVRARPTDPDFLFFSKDLQALSSPKEKLTLLTKAVGLILSLCAIFNFDNENLVARHAKQLAEGLGVTSKWKNEVEWLSVCKEYKLSIDQIAELGPMIEVLVDYVSVSAARCLTQGTVSETACHGSIAILAKWATKIKALSRDPQTFAKECLSQEVFHSVGRAYAFTSHEDPDDEDAPVAEGATRKPKKATFVSHFNRFNMFQDKQAYTHGVEPDAEDANSKTSFPPLKRFLLDAMMGDPTKTKAVEVYVAEQALLRKNVVQVVEHLLKTLGHQQLRSHGSSQLEICSMMYETGFEKSQVLVMQDWDGEFLGTSNMISTGIAIGGYRVLNEAIQAIANERELRREDRYEMGFANPYPIHCQWSFHVTLDEACPPASKNSLDSNSLIRYLTLSELVSLSVLFAFTSPIITNLLANREDLFNISRRSATAFVDQSQALEALGYTTSIRITSHQNVTREEEANNPAKPPFEGLYQGVKRIRGVSHITSTGRLKHNTELLRADTLRKRTNLSTSDSEKSGAQNPKEKREDVFRLQHILADIQQIRETASKMDRWVYGRSEVIVEVKLYVLFSVFLAFLLVAGGLAMGFVLGNRLPGVDPSNLATYCWVVALFILLLSRSMKVDAWTWRDYLLGRVRCRSVSELSAMSGIDAELILAKLLHDSTDSNIILRASGPFHYLFRKNKYGPIRFSMDEDSDSGFSIDVPLTMRTLLISGIIPLGVYTSTGVALVYLDVRRGTRYSMVGHNSNLLKQNQYFCSLDLPQVASGTAAVRNWLGELGRGKEARQSVRIRTKEIGWFKIYGVFCAENVKFV